MVNAQRESGLFSAIAGSLVETLKVLTIGLYAIFTALKIVGRIIGDVAALWLRGLEHEVNAIIQLFHLWVEAIKGVGTSLGEMVGSVRTAAEAMGQFVKGDFTGAFETARKGALDFGTAFLGVSDSVAQAAVKSAGIIGDVFTDTWGDAKVIYKQASEDIANDLESLMSFTSLITEGGQLSPVPSARAGGQGQMPGMVSQETQAAIQKATELLRRMNAEALDGLAKAMALEDARFQKQMRDIDDLAAKGAQVDELRQAALLEHQVRTDQINEAFAEKKFAVEDSITANLVDNYTRQEQVIDAQYRKRLQEIKQLGLSDQERIRLTVMAEQAAARQRAQLNISILQNNAQLFGQMAALSAQFGAKAFGVTKALRIGEAVMNTATGAARALADWPWPYSAVVAGIVAAMGAVQVALIASQKYTGQAHSGLTSVPMTGSFVLEKGERVIKTDQNADLTEFLATGRTTQVNLVLDGRTLSRWMFDSTRDGRTQIAEAAIV
jgi:hypothetical protein